MGLSAIEGGPFFQHLARILDEPESEEKLQLIRGLERTGIYQLLTTKKAIKFLFSPPKQSDLMTVTKFLRLFEPEFSDQGCSRRVIEEAAYKSFIRYLRDVFAGRREPVTIENITCFITGSEREPLLGFGISPSMSFVDDCDIPTATTCINRLYLPRKESLNYDLLDLAFVNTYFGHH